MEINKDWNLIENGNRGPRGSILYCGKRFLFTSIHMFSTQHHHIPIMNLAHQRHRFTNNHILKITVANYSTNLI